MQVLRKKEIKNGPLVFIAIIAMLFIQTGMGQTTSKKIKLPKLQDLEVHYLQAGSGKNKWVMVHGLGSYSKAYTKMLSNLPKDVEAFALDLPGFGKTPVSNKEISMTNYAEVVNQFVKELELKHVVLMGHSMGGQIAMTLAMENPKWLKQLILLSPAGIEKFTDKDRAWFDAVVTESLYLNLTDEQIRQNFNVNFYKGQLPKDAEFMYQDRLKIKQDLDIYKQYCSTIVSSIKAMLSGPVYEKLGAIKVPTLVLFGKNDALIPNKIIHPELSVEELMGNLERDYPDIQHKIIDESGHFIIWDQTKNVLQEIEQTTQAQK